MPGYDVTPGFPDDPEILVHTVRDEVISGQKTFTTAPKVATPATLNNQVVRKDYVDGHWALTGNIASYAPTWASSGTQPTLGNGTLAGFYYIVRDMVWIDVDLRIGSTTTLGTGEWFFSAPVLTYAYLIANPLPLGLCAVLDDSTTRYYSGWSYYGSSTGGIGIYGLTTASVKPYDSRISDVEPIAWAVNDRVRISCRARINV